MGARCVGHGGHVRPVPTPPPRYCEAYVKFLILTIDAPPPPPDLYCAHFVLFMCPPSFHSHRAPMVETQRACEL